MESVRIRRVQNEIRHTAGWLLTQCFFDPSVIVTVVQVSVSRDLRQAKIFLSIHGVESEDQLGTIWEEVQLTKRKLAKELRRRLRMKNMPQLHFCRDYGLEQTQRLVAILKEENPGVV